MPIGVVSRTNHRTKPTSSDGRGARTYMQHAPPGSRATTFQLGLPAIGGTCLPLHSHRLSLLAAGRLRGPRLRQSLPLSNDLVVRAALQKQQLHLLRTLGQTTCSAHMGSNWASAIVYVLVLVAVASFTEANPDRQQSRQFKSRKLQQVICSSHCRVQRCLVYNAFTLFTSLELAVKMCS